MSATRRLTTTPSLWASCSICSLGSRVVRGWVSVIEGVWAMGVTPFQGCCEQPKGITSPGLFQLHPHALSLTDHVWRVMYQFDPVTVRILNVGIVSAAILPASENWECPVRPAWQSFHPSHGSPQRNGRTAPGPGLRNR